MIHILYMSRRDNPKVIKALESLTSIIISFDAGVKSEADEVENEIQALKKQASNETANLGKLKRQMTVKVEICMAFIFLLTL